MRRSPHTKVLFLHEMKQCAEDKDALNKALDAKAKQLSS